MSILKTTLIAAVGMLAFVQHAEAQNCSDLYKQANALRKSKNYEQAISYYQRAKSCDNYLTNDCNKWIAWCRHQLPKIEVSKQVVIIPFKVVMLLSALRPIAIGMWKARLSGANL